MLGQASQFGSTLYNFRSSKRRSMARFRLRFCDRTEPPVFSRPCGGRGAALKALASAGRPCAAAAPLSLTRGGAAPARRGRGPGGALAQQALELPAAELGLAAGVRLAVRLQGFGRMFRSEIEAPSLL